MTLRKSRYGLFYGCTRWPECDCKHGAHPNGDPLGIPANRATREARIRAHAVFDPLAQRWGKKNAYRWLRDSLSLTKRETHIAKFDIPMCERTIEACNAAMNLATPHPGPEG